MLHVFTEGQLRVVGDSPGDTPGQTFGYAPDYGMEPVDVLEGLPSGIGNLVGQPISAVRQLDFNEIHPDKIRRTGRALARQTDVVSYQAPFQTHLNS
jgi:hypothetical protein